MSTKSKCQPRLLKKGTNQSRHAPACIVKSHGLHTSFMLLMMANWIQSSLGCCTIEDSVLISCTGCTGRTTINLVGNGIATLTPGCFFNMTTITAISLSSNEIATIPSGVFEKIPNLTFLYLDNNQLTSLGPNLLSGTPALERLYLNNNQLTSLDPNLLSDMPALQYLYLNNNQLTSLDPNLLSDMPALEVLYLDNNQLTSLDPNLLSGTPALRFLYLSYNQLTSLDPNLLSGTPALEVLYLSNNQLTSLDPNLLSGTPALRYLILSGNGISSFSSTIFSSLTSLTTLILSGNGISSLSSTVFSSLTTLTTLRLDNNNLQTLPPNIFDSLVSLGSLELSSNPGASMPCVVNAYFQPVWGSTSFCVESETFIAPNIESNVHDMIPLSSIQLGHSSLGHIGGFGQSIIFLPVVSSYENYNVAYLVVGAPDSYPSESDPRHIGGMAILRVMVKSVSLSVHDTTVIGWIPGKRHSSTGVELKKFGQEIVYIGRFSDMHKFGTVSIPAFSNERAYLFVYSVVIRFNGTYEEPQMEVEIPLQRTQECDFNRKMTLSAYPTGTLGTAATTVVVSCYTNRYTFLHVPIKILSYIASTEPVFTTHVATSIVAGPSESWLWSSSASSQEFLYFMIESNGGNSVISGTMEKNSSMVLDSWTRNLNRVHRSSLILEPSVQDCKNSLYLQEDGLYSTKDTFRGLVEFSGNSTATYARYIFVDPMGEKLSSPGMKRSNECIVNIHLTNISSLGTPADISMAFDQTSIPSSDRSRYLLSMIRFSDFYFQWAMVKVDVPSDAKVLQVCSNDPVVPTPTPEASVMPIATKTTSTGTSSPTSSSLPSVSPTQTPPPSSTPSKTAVPTHTILASYQPSNSPNILTPTSSHPAVSSNPGEIESYDYNGTQVDFSIDLNVFDSRLSINTSDAYSILIPVTQSEFISLNDVTSSLKNAAWLVIGLPMSQWYQFHNARTGTVVIIPVSRGGMLQSNPSPTSSVSPSVGSTCQPGFIQQILSKYCTYEIHTQRTRYFTHDFRRQLGTHIEYIGSLSSTRYILTSSIDINGTFQLDALALPSNLLNTTSQINPLIHHFDLSSIPQVCTAASLKFHTYIKAASLKSGYMLGIQYQCHENSPEQFSLMDLVYYVHDNAADGSTFEFASSRRIYTYMYSDSGAFVWPLISSIHHTKYSIQSFQADNIYNGIVETFSEFNESTVYWDSSTLKASATKFFVHPHSKFNVKLYPPNAQWKHVNNSNVDTFQFAHLAFDSSTYLYLSGFVSQSTLYGMFVESNNTDNSLVQYNTFTLPSELSTSVSVMDTTPMNRFSWLYNITSVCTTTVSPSVSASAVPSTLQLDEWGTSPERILLSMNAPNSHSLNFQFWKLTLPENFPSSTPIVSSPAATVSPTMTPIPSTTPTSTPNSASPTPTLSPTITPHPSNTSTSTPNSATPTPTRTPTMTPIPFNFPTSTPNSASPTPTRTPTMTSIPSTTPTSTPNSASPTPTLSPTITPHPSTTPTSTSNSVSPTPSIISNPSTTPTSTSNSASPTPTRTSTPTSIPSTTPTSTPNSASPTPTRTPSMTSIPSTTPTGTEASTRSFTSTVAPTTNFIPSTTVTSSPTPSVNMTKTPNSFTIIPLVSITPTRSMNMTKTPNLSTNIPIIPTPSNTVTSTPIPSVSTTITPNSPATSTVPAAASSTPSQSASATIPPATSVAPGTVNVPNNVYFSLQSDSNHTLNTSISLNTTVLEMGTNGHLVGIGETMTILPATGQEKSFNIEYFILLGASDSYYGNSTGTGALVLIPVKVFPHETYEEHQIQDTTATIMYGTGISNTIYEFGYSFSFLGHWGKYRYLIVSSRVKNGHGMRLHLVRLADDLSYKNPNIMETPIDTGLTELNSNCSAMSRTISSYEKMDVSGNPYIGIELLCESPGSTLEEYALVLRYNLHIKISHYSVPIYLTLIDGFIREIPTNSPRDVRRSITDLITSQSSMSDLTTVIYSPQFKHINDQTFVSSVKVEMLDMMISPLNRSDSSSDSNYEAEIRFEFDLGNFSTSYSNIETNCNQSSCRPLSFTRGSVWPGMGPMGPIAELGAPTPTGFKTVDSYSKMDGFYVSKLDLVLLKSPVENKPPFGSFLFIPGPQNLPTTTENDNDDTYVKSSNIPMRLLSESSTTQFPIITLPVHIETSRMIGYGAILMDLGMVFQSTHVSSKLFLSLHQPTSKHSSSFELSMLSVGTPYPTAAPSASSTTAPKSTIITSGPTASSLVASPLPIASFHPFPTSDASTNASPVATTLDASIHPPPMATISDASTNASPVATTLDASIHPPPVATTSDASINVSPVATTLDASIHPPPVVTTSDASINVSPVATTSDASINVSPVATTSDASINVSPVSTISNPSINPSSATTKAISPTIGHSSVTGSASGTVSMAPIHSLPTIPSVTTASSNLPTSTSNETDTTQLVGPSDTWQPSPTWIQSSETVAVPSPSATIQISSSHQFSTMLPSATPTDRTLHVSPIPTTITAIPITSVSATLTTSMTATPTTTIEPSQNSFIVINETVTAYGHHTNNPYATGCWMNQSNSNMDSTIFARPLIDRSFGHLLAWNETDMTQLGGFGHSIHITPPSTVWNNSFNSLPVAIGAPLTTSKYSWTNKEVFTGAVFLTDWHQIAFESCPANLTQLYLPSYVCHDGCYVFNSSDIDGMKNTSNNVSHTNWGAGVAIVPSTDNSYENYEDAYISSKKFDVYVTSWGQPSLNTSSSTSDDLGQHGIVAKLSIALQFADITHTPDSSKPNVVQFIQKTQIGTLESDDYVVQSLLGDLVVLSLSNSTIQANTSSHNPHILAVTSRIDWKTMQNQTNVQEQPLYAVLFTQWPSDSSPDTRNHTEAQDRNEFVPLAIMDEILFCSPPVLLQIDESTIMILESDIGLEGHIHGFIWHGTLQMNGTVDMTIKEIFSNADIPPRLRTDTARLVYNRSNTKTRHRSHPSSSSTHTVQVNQFRTRKQFRDQCSIPSLNRTRITSMSKFQLTDQSTQVSPSSGPTYCSAAPSHSHSCTMCDTNNLYERISFVYTTYTMNISSGHVDAHTETHVTTEVLAAQLRYSMNTMLRSDTTIGKESFCPIHSPRTMPNIQFIDLPKDIQMNTDLTQLNGPVGSLVVLPDISYDTMDQIHKDDTIIDTAPEDNELPLPMRRILKENVNLNPQSKQHHLDEILDEHVKSNQRHLDESGTNTDDNSIVTSASSSVSMSNFTEQMLQFAPSNFTLLAAMDARSTDAQNLAQETFTRSKIVDMSLVSHWWLQKTYTLPLNIIPEISSSPTSTADNANSGSDTSNSTIPIVAGSLVAILAVSIAIFFMIQRSRKRRRHQTKSGRRVSNIQQQSYNNDQFLKDSHSPNPLIHAQATHAMGTTMSSATLSHTNENTMALQSQSIHMNDQTNLNSTIRQLHPTSLTECAVNQANNGVLTGDTIQHFQHQEQTQMAKAKFKLRQWKARLTGQPVPVAHDNQIQGFQFASANGQTPIQRANLVQNSSLSISAVQNGQTTQMGHGTINHSSGASKLAGSMHGIDQQSAEKNTSAYEKLRQWKARLLRRESVTQIANSDTSHQSPLHCTRLENEAKAQPGAAYTHDRRRSSMFRKLNGYKARVRGKEARAALSAEAAHHTSQSRKRLLGRSRKRIQFAPQMPSSVQPVENETE